MSDGGWPPDLGAWTPHHWSTLATCTATIVAVVAIIVTGIYAHRQIEEAKKIREAQAQPFVVVDIVSSEAWANLLMLRVQNVGLTLARDVRLTFDPPLSSTTEQGRKMLAGPLLSEGISALPPRRKISRYDALNTHQHSWIEVKR